MEFRVLGELEVLAGDRPLELGGAKQRSVLSMLVLQAGNVVSTDTLIDGLWGERPPATAAKSLQVYVSRLRKALGENAIVTRPPGYLLDATPEQVDVDRFERLVDEAKREAPAAAAATLRGALELWRGSALADLADEPFARAEIARLEELRLAALEDRIDADLALGRHASVVAELEGLVHTHPYRERLRGQLMLALYRSGRQADALEAIGTHVALSPSELGLEPGPEPQGPRAAHPFARSNAGRTVRPGAVSHSGSQTTDPARPCPPGSARGGGSRGDHCRPRAHRRGAQGADRCPGELRRRHRPRKRTRRRSRPARESARRESLPTATTSGCSFPTGARCRI